MPIARSTPTDLTRAVRVAGRAAAPIWFVCLLAPEAGEEHDALGLHADARYFAARSAPLGPVPAEVVVSTFFNFSPRAVAPAIPAAWVAATPAAILDAQRRGVDRALRRALASVDDDVVAEAADLLRRAAEAAVPRLDGRPLFAAYAALEWPEAPHLVLWHAQYLLREFRGDGHIAVLVAEGLGGLEALLVQVAVLPHLTPFMRSTRAWQDDEWAAAIEGLRTTGWLTSDETPTLTEDGRARRRAIEDRTDELDLPGLGVLGTDGCARVVELATPIAAALAAGGLTLG